MNHTCQAGVCAGPVPGGTVAWSIPVFPYFMASTVSLGGLYMNAAGHAFVEIPWSITNGPQCCGGNAVKELDVNGKVVANRGIDYPGVYPYSGVHHTTHFIAPSNFVITASAPSTTFTRYEVLRSEKVNLQTFSNVGPYGAGVHAKSAVGNAAGDVVAHYSVVDAPFDLGWGPEPVGERLFKLDHAAGHVYSLSLPLAYTLAESGDVGFADSLAGSIDVGCGVISGASGYLARLDPLGGCVWSRAVELGQGTPSLVSAPGSDDVYVTNTHQGTIDLGCGPMTPSGASGRYVARLDMMGSCVWSRSIDVGSAVTLTPSATGGLDVEGSHGGTLDVGCGPMTAGAGNAAFFARLDPLGSCVWSRSFGGAAPKTARFPDGDLLISAAFSGSTSFGDSVVASVGVQDLAVGRFDGATGQQLWVKTFGGPGASLSGSALAAANGEAVLSGSLGGTVDFGGGAMSSAGGFTGFVVKLAASGAFVWSRAVSKEALAVVDPCGAVVLASADVGFDAGSGPPLASTGSYDKGVAVVKLNP